MDHQRVRIVKQITVRFFAITPRPAYFLIIIFNTGAGMIVDHITHVGFINSHTKSIGGGNNSFLIAHKLILDTGADFFV